MWYVSGAQLFKKHKLRATEIIGSDPFNSALAQLQAAQGGKSRITMRVDNDTLAIFKARAEMSNGNYQTLMNEALKQFAQGVTLSDVVRETIRQELHSHP